MPELTEALSTVALCILAGIASGILSSAPIGPANLWLATAALPPKKSLRNLVAYVAGIISVDIAYAGIAFYGYFVYFDGTPLGRWMGIVGGLGLVVLGGLEAWKLRPRNPTADGGGSNGTGSETDDAELSGYDLHSSWLKDFSVGAFICGSNPAFIMFWMMVAKELSEYGIGDLASSNSAWVFLGIALGDMLWYSLFSALVRLGLNFISTRFLHYVRIAVALALIVLGTVAAIRFA